MTDRSAGDSAFKRLLFQALSRRSLKVSASQHVQGGTSKSATREMEPDPGAKIQRGHRVRAGSVQRRRHRNRKATAPRWHNHYELRHTLVPHPKYGDRVPYFRTHDVEIDCNCDDARVTSSIKRRLRREERMRLQPAVVDASASSTAPGTSGTVQQQCARTTKLGTRCRRPANPASERGFCGFHEHVVAPEAVNFTGRGA